MNDDEGNRQKVLLSELIEEGVIGFLSQLQTPEQVYGILSVTAKDMHLAMNQHKDTSQFNL